MRKKQHLFFPVVKRLILTSRSASTIDMVAASPEAYARACFPFSILATHSSRHSRVGFPPREYSYLSCWRTPGDSCLKVVERPIKGTTDRESHFSGSCPAWIASVPKFLKGASPLKDDINEVKFKKCGEVFSFKFRFFKCRVHDGKVPERGYA